MPNTIDSVRQEILSHRGFQRPGFYEVVMDGPPGRLVTYPLDLTLPQRTFDIAPSSNWGPMTNLQVRRSYSECSMTLPILQDWESRKYMESWMDAIIPTNRDYSRGYDETSGKVLLRFLQSDKKDITNAGMILNKAFPLTITPTTLSASPDFGIATFVVIFSFKDYQFNTGIF